MKEMVQNCKLNSNYRWDFWLILSSRTLEIPTMEALLADFFREYEMTSQIMKVDVELEFHRTLHTCCLLGVLSILIDLGYTARRQLSFLCVTVGTTCHTVYTRCLFMMAIYYANISLAFQLTFCHKQPKQVRRISAIPKSAIQPKIGRS
jgi:hypothetical protein